MASAATNRAMIRVRPFMRNESPGWPGVRDPGSRCRTCKGGRESTIEGCGASSGAGPAQHALDALEQRPRFGIGAQLDQLECKRQCALPFAALGAAGGDGI